MEVTLETSRRNFESDMYEVLSSWLAHRDPIPDRWKPKANPKEPMRFSDVQDLGLEGCIDLMHQARDTVSRLKALSDSLSTLTCAVHEKLMAAQENFVSFSNLVCLVALPPELLSRIFNFVVNEDQGHTLPGRQKVAVTLSHVCRYFRDTALSCAHLWSNIGGSEEMAALCLSRSKNARLNVELRIGVIWREISETYDFLPNRILGDALHHSLRWKSLKIEFSLVRAEAGVLDRDSMGGSDIRRAFRDLNAPSLESFSIRGETTFYGHLTEVFGELESWNAPGIRHITSNLFFHFRLPGLANVTSFKLDLNLDATNVTDVPNYLSRLTALEDLQLTVQSSIRDVPLRDEKTTLLGVKRLHIILPIAGDHDFGSSSPLKSFFSSLFFPGVLDLRIFLIGDPRKRYPEADCVEMSLIEDMMCIFQHPDQSPGVESFHLKAYGVNGRLRDATPNQIGRISLVLPLGMLPSLKRLELSSNCHLLFSGDDGLGDSFFEKHPQFSWDSWLPGAPGMASPALETISINIIEERRWCRPVIEFVGGIMQKQKERGDWEIFRELVVVDTSKNQTSTSVYEGDAALQWCTDKEREEPWALLHRLLG
ncbi:hypothetical protein SCHPADRAFT_269849 [Schizopora paradoxa]|uniref:Uncharacterized protein n=1 Tax=Schizopora paradoxa TaxID=27342 RepID=A0A0H2RTJ2_9AGAM|nr:hypothetical protein SCHPADRAFT_269849 [Schizopora paradoxa]